jgi:hypothetical protein
LQPLNLTAVLADGSTAELDAELVSMGSNYHTGDLKGINHDDKGGSLIFLILIT